MEMINAPHNSYAMDIEPPPISGVVLPNEILLLTFQRLNKSGLKMARLVCNLWASIANPILFDKVFVSPNELQMQVFANIASHPIFSQTVRKLVYSTSNFSSATRVEYGTRLFTHIRSYLPHHLHWDKDKMCPQHPDPDIQEILSYVHGNRLSAAPSYPAVILKSELLKRGYFAYNKARVEQDLFMSNGEFLARLCLGLSKIPKVIHLQFMCSWTCFREDRGCDCFPACRYPCYSGSGPLARSWDRLFLRPTFQHTGYRTADHVHFEAALRAIQLTGHKLETIDIPTNFGVSQHFWDWKTPFSRVIINEQTCFHTTNLRALTLRITPCHHREHDSWIHYGGSQSIQLLAPWLYDMLGLKFLNLGLGHATAIMDNDYREQLPMRPVQDAFLFDRELGRLEVLKLQGMRGSEAQLISLLRMQPALRHLTLEYIELAKGSWETLFDQMHAFLTLQSLELRLELINPDGSRLMEPDAWYENDIRKKIEFYVLHGGVNPLKAEVSAPVYP